LEGIGYSKLVLLQFSNNNNIREHIKWIQFYIEKKYIFFVYEAGAWFYLYGAKAIISRSRDQMLDN